MRWRPGCARGRPLSGATPSTLRYRVDTRLAKLLSENYRSSEAVLKELIDNAWGADAETVRISLPRPMTQEPIIIDDDGTA